MKVLLTGGGTGGHITPLLAVAHELKKQPDCEVIYVGERGGKFSHLTDTHHDIDSVFTVRAGKYRRYYGQSWWRKILDFKSLILNIRDFFYFMIGILQAYRLLGKVKPDVIFLKGGFVGVPVGIAAHLRKIPFMTHDSDAIPGLANRIVGRWAKLHATALPAEEYNYPTSQVRQVGVLVGPDYQLATPERIISYRQQLGLPGAGQILLVTGGSLGASRLNKAVINIIDKLLKDFPNLYVIHQVGKGKLDEYGGYQNERLQALEFLTPLYAYSGAADLVVTRAGANTLAELGAQGKACIVVPNPQLTEGHQLKNAQRLAENNAAVVVEEGQLPAGLDQTIRQMLNEAEKRQRLGKQFQSQTLTNAAARVAALLQEIAKSS